VPDSTNDRRMLIGNAFGWYRGISGIYFTLDIFCVEYLGLKQLLFFYDCLFNLLPFDAGSWKVNKFTEREKVVWA